VKKSPNLKIQGNYQAITGEFPNYPYLRFRKTLLSRGDPNLGGCMTGNIDPKIRTKIMI